jgi:DNA-binding beta-propeller fold protein YncE
VGTYPVGTNPFGVAFDGSSIWVANGGTDTVTKLNAATGNLIGTYALPAGEPVNLAFDGTDVWVADGADLVAKL